jgi:hypothetical protein
VNVLSIQEGFRFYLREEALISGDKVTDIYYIGEYSNKNVGSNKAITLHSFGAMTEHYTLDESVKELRGTITPRPVTFEELAITSRTSSEAQSIAKEYDRTTQVLQKVSLLERVLMKDDLPFTFTMTYPDYHCAIYPQLQIVSENPNYKYAGKNLEGVIYERQLQISDSIISKEYDGTDYLYLDRKFSKVFSEDRIFVKVTYEDANCGENKPFTLAIVPVVNGALDYLNYTINSVNTVGSITPGSIKINILDQKISQLDQEINYSYNNLSSDEVPAFSGIFTLNKINNYLYTVAVGDTFHLIDNEEGNFLASNYKLILDPFQINYTYFNPIIVVAPIIAVVVIGGGIFGFYYLRRKLVLRRQTEEE